VKEIENINISKQKRELIMLIFDLDGTLADCSHRQHFVDPEKDPNARWWNDHEDGGGNYIRPNGLPWKPNWAAFYEACSDDKPIEPVLSILSKYITADSGKEVQIWTGRCESVREKTIKWFRDNWFINLYDFEVPHLSNKIKMRPIGDYTPAAQLKERWLKELDYDTKWGPRNPVEMVFEDCPKCIAMYRSHGIFVFDVNQGN
jgi:hypothetical protein